LNNQTKGACFANIATRKFQQYCLYSVRPQERFPDERLAMSVSQSTTEWQSDVAAPAKDTLDIATSLALRLSFTAGSFARSPIGSAKLSLKKRSSAIMLNLSVLPGC
jgi:hypothetical protein